MNKTISATEAVRKFSEILNSIKYKGEHYTIVRGGKPVASIHPAEPFTKEKTLADLNDLLGKLPPLGEDAEVFQNDVKKVMSHQPSMPEKGKWD